MSEKWKDSLINCIHDPAKILFKDDLIAIIADAYPKSAHHFLVLSLDSTLNSVTDLNRRHIFLVDHMYKEGMKFSQKFTTRFKFKYGFHMRPSMNRLHLHVITSDHNSNYIRKKKHYNSFNTPFFQTPEVVIQNLQMYNKVVQPNHEAINSYLNAKLKCNQCDQPFDNLAPLRKHLKNHYNRNEIEMRSK